MGSSPSDFRLARSILRRWPKAAAVTRSSARRSQGRGSARGTSCTSDDVTFGGGTNADGRDVEQDLRLRAPARQHREAAIGLRAGLGDDALGDLALEHQHEPVVPGRPRLDGEPRDEQRGRDVVGQVGDDADRAAAEIGPRVEFQRVAGHDRQPARIVLGDLAPAPRPRARRARSRPRVAPSASSARVSPPGPGPTSITVTPASGPAARAIRPVRLRSSRKFWPSDLRAESSWRRMTSRSGGSVVGRVHFAGAIASARNQPCRELERRDEACRIGAARCRRCRTPCRDRARCARKAARASR